MNDMKTLEELLPEKSKMQDNMGRPLTQSLFLEIGYSDSAVYTLKEDDYEYEGRYLPSLKRLYLLIADPTEYEFSQICLLGWKHWQRLCDNKVVRKHIDEWRSELEYKLRSQGVRSAIAQANGGSFQAAKWLADRGWENRGAGRPSAEEKERRLAQDKRIEDDYSADIIRLTK